LDVEIPLTILNIKVDDKVQAHLLIEVDGNYPEILMLEAEKITCQLLEQFEIDEVLFADTEDTKKCTCGKCVVPLPKP
jgi:glycolate oxidase